MAGKSKFNLQKKLDRVSRYDVVVFGILLGVVLLLAVVGWDVYIFYNNVLVKREASNFSREFITSLQELSVVSDILDDRQIKFEEILSE